MVYYIAAVLVSIALYTTGLLCMKYLVKYRKISDIDFPSLIFILYFIEIVLLLVDVGFKDWSYLTLLPLGNVGPFMFFTLPFYFLLPKKARKFALTIVALLSPAMLVYGIMRGVALVVAGTKAYASYVLDILCHVVFAVYGIYLVRSEQVDLDVKRSLISGGILLGVSVLMLILNAIFKTSFFGLSVYGNHNLSNIIFLKSAVLSIFVYFIALAALMTVGYFFQKYLAVASKALFGDAKNVSPEAEDPDEGEQG